MDQQYTDLDLKYRALSKIFEAWENTGLCQIMGDAEATDLTNLARHYAFALTQVMVQGKQIEALRAEKEALNQQLKDLTKGVLSALKTNGDQETLAHEYA